MTVTATAAHTTVVTLPDEPGIYTIINIVTERQYIGSGVSIARRWREHKSALKRGIHRNSKLQHSWDKHGGAVFICKALIHCDAKNLLLYEQLAIKAFDSVKCGYNICPVAGNALGIKHTEKSKENFRKGAIGRIMPPQSAEARLAKSLAAQGRAGPPMTVERRAKISASLKGIKRGRFTDEHRRKLSDAKRGRVLSEAHKSAISLALTKSWLSR